MSRRNKAALNLISGLIINYNDSDPLTDTPNPDTIQGLPYGHKNPVLKPLAHKLFAENRKLIFNNELRWCITVTVISITGEPMREPVEVLARCKIAQLTEAAESYIEEVFNEIDMDFYSHVNFSCLVRK